MSHLSLLTKQILDGRVSVEQARAIVIARAAAQRERRRQQKRDSWKRRARRARTYNERFEEWAAA